MSIIYINGRFLTQKVTGEQRYAIEMTKALDDLLLRKQEIGEEWQLLLPNDKLVSAMEDLKKIKVRKKGILKSHLWEQLELPYYARKGFLINFCDMAPILLKKQIVTIHDMAIMIYPQYYTKNFRWWHIFVYKCLRRNLHRFLTVSEFSKKELGKSLNIRLEEISVVHCACSSIFKKNIFVNDVIGKWKINTKNKIILAVSSVSPNKNFLSIMKAIDNINRDDIELIIVGGRNKNEFGNHRINALKHTKYVGYVTDEELITLYKVADCFVYPSFYEGFGIPPLEAMVNGCVVIVSNRASLPEVCGSAALYCNPESPQDIAEKIATVISDDAIRERLKEEGYRRAKKFSWEKSANDFYIVLKNTMNNLR